jgi:putative transposase
MKLADKRPAGMSLNSFCKYMCITRSNFYYEHRSESSENLKIMQIIDDYFLDHPTTGVVRMTQKLRLSGYRVNEKRVRRLMRKMGIMAIFPQKCLSKGVNTMYVYPYLLRDLSITHPNQVWSTDISYIPMYHGFMYLYAVIDVYSRYLLGWTLSNTLSASNCTDLLSACAQHYGTPEIINTDQGCQYTSSRWVNLINQLGICISMDGRGRCKDNIWIERFWRSIKREYIYLNPTDNVEILRKGIGHYIDDYNMDRPHQSLGGSTPYMSYNGIKPDGNLRSQQGLTSRIERLDGLVDSESTSEIKLPTIKQTC